MRRILATTVIAAAAFSGFTGSAQAICAANVLCATQDTCSGAVNYCPGSDYCHGGVNVCEDAGECDGLVNICPDAGTCSGGVNVCDFRVSAAQR